jgi:hypothetical protein
MMRKQIAVLALFLVGAGAAPANAGVKTHALGKVAAAVAAPVVHPKRTLKQTLGVIVFATESVVDVAHAGTTALSAAAAKELKVNPFEYVDKFVGYADSGLEKAELFLFGSSN